jgi:hypothetical protein
MVQVVAHAYAEPLEKTKKAASMSMKVTLVTLDCLFLGTPGLEGDFILFRCCPNLMTT